MAPLHSELLLLLFMAHDRLLQSTELGEPTQPADGRVPRVRLLALVEVVKHLVPMVRAKGHPARCLGQLGVSSACGLLRERLEDLVHVDLAIEVIRLDEVAQRTLPRSPHVSQVHKEDFLRVLRRHRLYIIHRRRRVAAHAESETVVRRGRGGEERAHIGVRRDHARQPEQRAWRVIWMDGHVHARLFGHGHHGTQKVGEVGAKSLGVELLVRIERALEGLERVRFRHLARHPRDDILL